MDRNKKCDPKITLSRAFLLGAAGSALANLCARQRAIAPLGLGWTIAAGIVLLRRIAPTRGSQKAA